MIRIISLMILLGAGQFISAQGIVEDHGALVRSDTLQREVYLCFTGHDHKEGFPQVLKTLAEEDVKASFFFTGDFVRNNRTLVIAVKNLGHSLGAHSDRHLLYCDWQVRDSLLHPPELIKKDIEDNLEALRKLDIDPRYFMPPYEWYNKKVVEIAESLGQITVNFSQGTLSNADYTTPEMDNYRTSEEILKSIYDFEAEKGMSGFHLLIHPGTSPARKDKLYSHLGDIIRELKSKGYRFKSFE